MAKQPDRRTLKLRRSITPSGEAGSAPTLSRAVWGVAAADAERALLEQQQVFAAELAALNAETAAERARFEQLSAESEQLQHRLASLRQIVEVLREKLARERAARAVLAARLLDRQLEEQKAVQAAAASRLETARLGADIQQEHEAVKQLVAALYRSLAGRNGVPAGLEPLAQIPAAPAVQSRRVGAAQVVPWQRFLVGKKAGRTLTTPDGRVLIREGETIGPDEMNAAEEAGLLFELILTMRFVERIPDL